MYFTEDTNYLVGLRIGYKLIKKVNMDQEELDYQKGLVYRASMEFMKIKGLEEFIDYLQLVDETDRIPAGSALDKETYVSVLRQAINDYRKQLLKE